jgi:hypothetical protein
MRADTPDMTTRTGFSKEQDRDSAAENQECLTSCLEKARWSSFDTCFCRRGIVVCGNFLRAEQGLVDLWRLTHRHDNFLQRRFTLFGMLAGKQGDRDSDAMTQINW